MMPGYLQRSTSFGKVSYVVKISEVGILRPDYALVGPRCGQDDAVSHWEMVLQAQFGGVQGKLCIEIDNFPFLHCSDGL